MFHYRPLLLSIPVSDYRELLRIGIR